MPPDVSLLDTLPYQARNTPRKRIIAKYGRELILSNSENGGGMVTVRIPVFQKIGCAKQGSSECIKNSITKQVYTYGHKRNQGK